MAFGALEDVQWIAHDCCRFRTKNQCHAGRKPEHDGLTSQFALPLIWPPLSSILVTQVASISATEVMYKLSAFLSRKYSGKMILTNVLAAGL